MYHERMESNMISNCGHDENNKYHGGKAGDQTGTEYRVISWYNRPWNYVLRPIDRAVGNRLALIARQAAENNNIGYDQYERLTYYNVLEKADWHPEKITTKCETDCTASTVANVVAVGHQLGIKALQGLDPKLYSGNIRKGLMATGCFETLTASKYLTSDKYLLPGDILLYENHHAAINLDTGSAVSSETTSSSKPSTSETAKNVINGKYGNGQDRIDRLKKLGYTDAEIKEIQSAVNAMLKTSSASSSKPVAKKGYSGTFPTLPTRGYFMIGDGYRQLTGSNTKTQIQRVQSFLNWAVNAGLSVDGDYGPKTSASVIKFQKTVGISADGKFGKNTLAKAKAFTK